MQGPTQEQTMPPTATMECEWNTFFWLDYPTFYAGHFMQY